jgi:hypothetical protein
MAAGCDLQRVAGACVHFARGCALNAAHDMNPLQAGETWLVCGGGRTCGCVSYLSSICWLQHSLGACILLTCT